MELKSYNAILTPPILKKSSTAVEVKQKIFANLSLDVHCSKSVKFYGFDSTAVSLFCYIGGAKIAL